MEQEITSYADSEPSKREMALRPKNYWKSSFSGMKFFIQSLNGENPAPAKIKLLTN